MKKSKLLMLLAASFIVFSISACGNSSKEEEKAPAEENISTEEETVTESETTEESSEIAAASNGTLSVSIDDIYIVINDTKVPMPYDLDDILATGIPDADYLKDIELGSGDYFSPDIFIDENEDYLVYPDYYNEGDDALPITEAEATSISMSTYSSEPVDQNVSLFGIKFGMTRDEVKAILGDPEWDTGNEYQWLLTVADADYEGNFSIYFTSDADDAAVSQATLTLY